MTDAKPSVRTARGEDIGALAQTLARAFEADPIICHLLGARDRLQRRNALFTVLATNAAAMGAVDVLGDFGAAAIWRPPGREHIPFSEILRNLLPLLNIFGTRAGHVLIIQDRIDRHHPRTPHWYLQAVGTEPARQGKGLGGHILRHRLGDVDRAGMPAYLESSKASNIPVYERLGFEVTGSFRLPFGGPEIFPMWRPAQQSLQASGNS